MRVAIIGGGPMGLAAGYYALKKGYSVDIYEKDNVLGGSKQLTNLTQSVYLCSGMQRKLLTCKRV